MASMQEFHHADQSRDKTTKIVAWVVVALLLGGFGAFLATSGFFSSDLVVQNYPRAL